MRDLERLVGRLAYGAASHSTLLGISDTLNAVPDIKKLIAGKKDALIKLVNSDLDPLENLSLLLNSALERENKKLVKGKEGEGYIVKRGSMRNSTHCATSKSPRKHGFPTSKAARGRAREYATCT